MNLKRVLEECLKRGLEKNLDNNLEKSLKKNLKKNLYTDNCAELGQKRASTANLTCSIAIVAIISLALPRPLGASPKPLVASPKSLTTKGAVGGSAGGSSAWCHAVVSQPLPQGKVVGSVGGQPFKPEFIQWNSYSITLKQNRKRYCKVVINMMRRQKPLSDLAFTSDSNNRPHIYVYTRSTNSQPIKEQHYTSKDGYGLKLALLSPLADDWIPGSLSLRLPDGSSVAGSFKAEKAPRIIWDDESVNP
jgi:hypothetical protein